MSGSSPVLVSAAPASGFTAVNFHFWIPCNMSCGYCFATFDDVRGDLPKGFLPKAQVLDVIRALALAGFDKINFVGGEPSACPWLDELIDLSCDLGLTVSMVTNGARVDRNWLNRMAGKLNWLGLSMDSLIDETNRRIGRTVNGLPMSADRYAALCADIHAAGIRLKVNTVVSAFNHDEDLAGFVNEAKPERWKIFQALPVAGQNDANFDRFRVTLARFEAFVARQAEGLHVPAVLVPENNEAMRDSYVMVDPLGRFFNNATGAHFYSQPILQVGALTAFAQVQPSFKKFLARDGLYDWRLQSRPTHRGNVAESAC